jgi:hypothetical protein
VHTGGFIDEGESDLEAVYRELKEEIGVDVSNSSQYAWLGRLDNRFFGPKSKLLFPHVFLYLGKSPPELTLEPKEIAAARWIDASAFLEKDLGCSGHLTYPISVMFKNKTPSSVSQYTLLGLAKVFGFANLHFPCVRVPAVPSLKCGVNCGVECEKDCWLVWGITYNTLRCLVMLVDKHHAASEKISEHAMNHKSAFWIDNSLANVFIGVFDKVFNDKAKKDKNGYSNMIICSVVSMCTVYATVVVVVAYATRMFIL